MLTILTLFFGIANGIHSLRDEPIVADEILYLDSTNSHSWTVSSMVTPRGTSCSFQENLDFNYPLVARVINVTSKEECCSKCVEEFNCYAGVFTPATNQCYFKSSSDLMHRAKRSGSMACVLQNNATPQLISIAASVPGDLLSDLEHAGIIGDPLYELNFKNASIWDGSHHITDKQTYYIYIDMM